MPKLNFTMTHSALEAFATCPRQYEAKYVRNAVKFEPSVHTDLGNAVHKLAEWYVKHYNDIPTPISDTIRIGYPCTVAAVQAAIDATDAHLAKVDVVLEYWSTLEKALRSMRGSAPLHATFAAEQQMAMTNDLQPASYWDKSALLRGKLDLVVNFGSAALLVDYKTGKVKPSAQMARSALLLFANFPNLAVVRTLLLPTHSASEPITDTFTRDSVSAMSQVLRSEVAGVVAAYESDDFPPIPSGLCKAYCPVTSCSYNGNKDGG